jgi:hypothetical protein
LIREFEHQHRSTTCRQSKKGSVNSIVLFIFSANSNSTIQQMRQIGAQTHAQLFHSPCQREYVLFRFDAS